MSALGDAPQATAAQDVNALAAGLPILEVLDQAVAALDEGASLVLRAPPGAGKTTVLPLAILERCSGAWLGPGQRILVGPCSDTLVHRQHRCSLCRHACIAIAAAESARLPSSACPPSHVAAALLCAEEGHS